MWVDVMVVQKQMYTYAAFERFTRQPENRERRFELINGEIVEVSPSFVHARIAHLLSLHLGIFNLKHRLGEILIEARYKLPGDDHNAYIPDVSFLRDTSDVPRQGAIPRMPDLAIEIQSPDDDEDKLREKAAYYLANGALMVWLFFTETEAETVEVHRPDSDVLVLTIDDTLDGGAALPGFSLSLREIFG